jgi:hypothetical protein
MPHKASEISIEVPSLFLFVGPADSGKSYAASSFGFKSKEFGGDDPRPCYVMDCDGRVQALRGRPVEYDSYTNIDGAIGVINRLIEIRETCIKFNKAPFHTLVCPDSFTSFCDFAIADSLEITEKANEGKKAGDRKGRLKGNLQLLTFDDYGYEAEAVRKLLWENLNDIKRFANVIVTAHEVTKWRTIPPTNVGGLATKVDDGLQILARDKISARLPVKFDEIYHFQPKETIISTKQLRRTVCFQSILGRTSHPALQRLGTVPQDITGKEFYPYWQSLISQS